MTDFDEADVPDFDEPAAEEDSPTGEKQYVGEDVIEKVYEILEAESRGKITGLISIFSRGDIEAVAGREFTDDEFNFLHSEFSSALKSILSTPIVMTLLQGILATGEKFGFAYPEPDIADLEKFLASLEDQLDEPEED